MSAHKFSFGWKRQKPDHRDWHYVVPRRVTAQLPPKMDLSANMPSQLDQGQLGSCGPNSADECIEYDQRVEGQPVVSASRLFMYWVTRSLMGAGDINIDSGVDNRTMLKALAKYGYCSEAMWSYDIAKFKERPPQECFQAAKANRIKSYAVVQQTLDQMRGCIASGFPFIFGFDIFESFMSDAVAKTGVIPMPMTTPGDSQIGGHDITIFGYDDTKQMFRFRNHWVNPDGTPWGDNGNGYFPYEYALSKWASDFWAFNAVPANAPSTTSSVAMAEASTGAGTPAFLAFLDGSGKELGRLKLATG